ncbi:zinc-dependent alcohol dehydrogenase family protein [Amycolatopsis sp. DSM 110486]|uniref:zinc-dependent alcohol dehydrogenase family protein n=1 Tax=Amycolatopsis sp. DSM 110486 TaxID=2865832 RepID=UPI001C69DFFF|nr:zinc-dependent alcohol dehydrogenase family protein [Amycolatopsis sp. DSM 110486]QYN24477.1 zinc-dependent alcohol dehydrogenase family protein [Amycolatopsis sp. DSM 110486]
MSQLILTGVGDANIRIERNADLALGDGDVLVTLEAAPVNPADFLLANGWYGVQPQIPSVLGSEGVGRVASVGPNVDAALAGKRVVILPTYEQGTWADQAVVPARNLVVVPDDADARQLAMLAINPATAYLLLSRYVDLKPGDWIGQNLGNSAVGQAAVALAKRAGVKTLSIVRREDAAQQVRDLGGDLVLVDGEDLGERIAGALDGAQLKLVLDGAADATAGALATALEFGGTVVAYSSATGAAAQLPLGDLIYRELNLRGFWLINWIRTAPREEIQRVYGELADLVAKGVLSAKVEATYQLEDYQAAFDHARKPGRAGKVLFTF